MSEPAVSSRRVADIVLLAIAYAGMGWLARQLWLSESPSLYASAIWPAAGIALGALLARGPGLWPGIWLGTCAIEIPGLLAIQSPLLAALGAGAIATGTTLQAVVGNLLVRRLLPDQLALDTGPAVLRFLVFAGPLACLTSASIGSFTLYLLGDKSVEKGLVDWLTWWSGDTIGVLLVTPIVLSLLGKPRDIWKPRLATVALPLLVAIALVTTGLSIINRLEYSNHQIEFEHHADRLTHSLRRVMLGSVAGAQAMADFFDASKEVTQEEFNRFARGVSTRHVYLHALFWVPHNPGGTARFAIRYAYAGTDGDIVPGHDLARDPALLGLLQQARTSRRFVISPPLHWPQGDPRAAKTLLTIVPWFGSGTAQREGDLRGFLLAVARIDTLLDVAEQDLPPNNINYRIVDAGAPSEQGLLIERGDSIQAKLHRHAVPLMLGDRNWQLSFSAGDTFKFEHRAWYAWATLASGVAVSAALTFFLLVMSGRTLRTEQLVRERTAELEKARAAAEKTNQLLHEAVSSIAQGFTIYDEHDRLVVCNEAYRRIYATSADLIVPGNTFEEIVRRGAERGQYQAAIGRVDEWVKARVAQHQTADGCVIEQRLDDGRWLLIVEHRTPSGYIVGNRIDITELKRTAAALEDRNAQLNAILQLSPDGLVSFSKQGAVKSANPAFIRMTGLSEAEIYGLSQKELEDCLRERAEDPEQWPGLESCFAKVSADVTAADSEGRQILVLRRPHAAVLDLVGVNSDSPSISRLLYLRDVTHEAEVDRMKSEFLSHAAHELRTPMASIYGFTELLISQEFDADMRQDLLQTIHKQTAWLIEIINELLDIARIESRRGKDFKIEAVPLAPVVAEVLSAMQIDAQRWPLAVDLPADLPAVMADAAKLRQALTNVLGNAVKYSPDGGVIALHGLVDASDGKTRVGIVIADHGVGMKPEQAARVCERFYRADTSGNIPGTGLGMAIVKEIIELLGGKVEIASAVGAGTSVTLWLPASSADTSSSAKGLAS